MNINWLRVTPVRMQRVLAYRSLKAQELWQAAVVAVSTRCSTVDKFVTQLNDSDCIAQQCVSGTRKSELWRNRTSEPIERNLTHLG